MKNNLIVYRFEDENGRGPYLKQYRWARRMHILPRNPCPDECPKIKNIMYAELDDDSYKRWFFGFTNKKQIVRWFDKEEIKRMKELGYKLVKYKVKKHKVVETERQAIFIKEAARKVA